MTLPQVPASRRLFAWFLLTAVVPALSLAWLGWRLVAQDRELERQRARDRRDQAAELGATALQRTLAQLDARLSSTAAAASVPAWPDDGSAIVVFGPRGVVDRAGTPILFAPAPADPISAQDERLGTADLLEFQRRDPGGAIRALEALIAGPDGSLRAEALLRLGRNQRRLGDMAAALQTYDELATLDAVLVEGRPAGFAAAQGRALIFAAAGRTEDLRREAVRLREALNAGRWLLDRALYEASMDQVRGWLSNDPTDAPRPDRLALTAAAEAVWTEWRSSGGAPLRHRRAVWTENGSVLVLTRASPGRLAALLVAPRFLDDAWRGALASPHPAVDFALADAEGRSVLGQADAPLFRQSIRPALVTQLPWSVHAIESAEPLASPRLSEPARLMLTGVLVMVLVVGAGGYFITRAIAREMRVAQLQSDFVAAVSHEFRTPLTSLRQLSDLLVRGRVSSDERRVEFYETLQRESARLDRLVESLLNFGRMEAGKLQVRLETIDPGALVREVAAEFQANLSPRGFSVELAVDDTPRIRADRELLARVFWNLLDNAVKYSPYHRTIRVSLSAADGQVRFAVRDHGIGIPAAEREAIFGKFVRGAASMTMRITGAGIGLAMARHIVTAHGGAISVQSEPGAGSTFTVALPAVQSKEHTPWPES